MTTRRQSGFTLIEVLVALAIFGMGASAIWYGFTGVARIHARTTQNQMAFQLARSELELLRIRPKAAIHDSSYTAERLGASFFIERVVFDSSKIVDSLEAVDLDKDGKPIYLRRPLEIVVRVRVKRPGSDIWYDPDIDEREPVVELHLLKPEYLWH